MFNDLKEKISYVKALAYIASLDSNFGDEEKVYVKEVSKRFGLSDSETDMVISEIAEKQSLLSILSGIKERSHKLMLVNELIALCYADGSYSDKEKEGIRKICIELNVEEDKIIKIEELMEKRIALEKETYLVLEMEA